jgi:hypothetical protein
MYNFLPRQMQSRHGFEGCLASLDLNGESPDTTLDALVPSPLVVPGCEGEILNLNKYFKGLISFFKYIYIHYLLAKNCYSVSM